MAGKGEFATPPWTSLRELEQASIAFENDESGLDEKWLKQLLAPGSSLGGARPKASVMAPDGSSYLEIVSFLKANGVTPKKDIQELWKRIAFSMAVSNTDDHFRNHGFILKGMGWELSPMYDVNPDIYGEYLSLNVDEDNSSIDFELAIEAAPFYEMSKTQAQKNIADVKKIVGDNWRTLAGRYGISRGEIERMRPAFQECDSAKG